MTERFVIQSRFAGSHGRPANQFFGGISTCSGYPLWVNLLAEAIQYPTQEQARLVLSDRIHSRKASHTYSVVAARLADETARRPEVSIGPDGEPLADWRELRGEELSL